MLVIQVIVVSVIRYTQFFNETIQMGDLNNNSRLDVTTNIRTLNPGAFVIQEGAFLFRAGDRLDGLYRVNSGSVKLYRISEEGEIKIIGFYLQSDLIGLDALADGISRSNAITMDISNISLIPFTTIFHHPKGFDHEGFIHKLGASYNRDMRHSIVLSQLTSRRLAWFLLEYSDAMAKCHFSPVEFILPMSRTDIALFLGMAVETLSRMFAGLRKQGILSIEHRKVRILEVDSLRKIADGNTAEESERWGQGVSGRMNGKKSAHGH